MLADYGPDGGDACRAALGAAGPDEVDRNSARWAYSCWEMGVCSLVELACRSALTQPGQDQESCAGRATFDALVPDISVIIAAGIEKIGVPGWIPCHIRYWCKCRRAGRA